MTVRLDTFAFEIRYAFGHTYLDRCGQTLVDLERLGVGWIAGDVSPLSGHLENVGSGASIQFDAERFVYSAMTEPTVADHAMACAAAWEIVRANLGLSEFVRTGVRFHWLMPCTAIDQAESLLKRSSLNLCVPTSITEKYSLARRSMVLVVKSTTGAEYRLALQSVTRAQGVPVASLATTEPRLLPKHRREARQQQLLRRREYDGNPQYGINLDVDCVEYAQDDPNPAGFITAHYATATADFLPLAAGLK